MAIARRAPKATVIVHADRGGQFRSRAFKAVLKANGLTLSMGRVASAADNAAMESFHALLQKNVLDQRRTWATPLRAPVRDRHLDRAHLQPASAAAPARKAHAGRVRTGLRRLSSCMINQNRCQAN